MMSYNIWVAVQRSTIPPQVEKNMQISEPGSLLLPCIKRSVSKLDWQGASTDQIDMSYYVVTYAATRMSFRITF